MDGSVAPLCPCVSVVLGLSKADLDWEHPKDLLMEGLGKSWNIMENHGKSWDMFSLMFGHFSMIFIPNGLLISENCCRKGSPGFSMWRFPEMEAPPVFIHLSMDFP
jgi:hypothetical protein